MFSYFKNQKTTYFDVFYVNFSIETKIKTIFQISYFNLSKKPEMALRMHGLLAVAKNLRITINFYKKLCRLVIPWDNKHLSKQVVPIIYTLGSEGSCRGHEVF